jgi:hypothetical protein
MRDGFTESEAGEVPWDPLLSWHVTLCNGLDGVSLSDEDRSGSFGEDNSSVDAVRITVGFRDVSPVKVVASDSTGHTTGLSLIAPPWGVSDTGIIGGDLEGVSSDDFGDSGITGAGADASCVSGTPIDDSAGKVRISPATMAVSGTFKGIAAPFRVSEAATRDSTGQEAAAPAELAVFGRGDDDFAIGVSASDVDDSAGLKGNFTTNGVLSRNVSNGRRSTLGVASHPIGDTEGVTPTDTVISGAGFEGDTSMLGVFESFSGDSNGLEHELPDDGLVSRIVKGAANTLVGSDSATGLEGLSSVNVDACRTICAADWLTPSDKAVEDFATGLDSSSPNDVFVSDSVDNGTEDESVVSGTAFGDDSGVENVSSAAAEMVAASGTVSSCLGTGSLSGAGDSSSAVSEPVVVVVVGLHGVSSEDVVAAGETGGRGDESGVSGTVWKDSAGLWGASSANKVAVVFVGNCGLGTLDDSGDTVGDASGLEEGPLASVATPAAVFGTAGDDSGRSWDSDTQECVVSGLHGVSSEDVVAVGDTGVRGDESGVSGTVREDSAGLESVSTARGEACTGVSGVNEGSDTWEVVVDMASVGVLGRGGDSLGRDDSVARMYSGMRLVFRNRFSRSVCRSNWSFVRKGPLGCRAGRSPWGTSETSPRSDTAVSTAGMSVVDPPGVNVRKRRGSESLLSMRWGVVWSAVCRLSSRDEEGSGMTELFVLLVLSSGVAAWR